MDGDGLLDVVVVQAWGLQSAGVVVLQGTSTAPYLTLRQSLSLPYPYEADMAAFALADVNADGKLDLVTSWGAVSTQFGNFSPSIAIMEGAGATLGNPRVIPLPGAAFYNPRLTVGDYNQDRTWDVAVSTTEQVYLLQGVCR